MEQITMKLNGCSSSRIEQITNLLNNHNIDFTADRYFTQLNFNVDDLFGNKEKTIDQLAKTLKLELIKPKPEFVDYGYFD